MTREPPTTPLSPPREARRALVRARPGRLGDRGIRALERADALDRVGLPLQRALRRFASVPALRRVKDLLNGTWLGHPLHPALTDVPIGAWTTALVFDAMTVMGARKLDRAAEAAVGVGIVGAAASAVTGLADWADTSASQRRVGVAHAGLNTLALGLQIASFVCRRKKLGGARALSVVGYGIAAVAGYLGGSLVFRQGVQVSRNAYETGPRSFVPAAREADLVPETPTRAMAGDAAVLLVKRRDEIFALDDVCSHAGCPLSQGRLEGDAIVCGCHGSTFRLRDGAVLHGPSPFSQPTFDVRVDEGVVAVRRRR